MRVFLGTDHAGLELKSHLMQVLADEGYEPVDCGAFDYDPQDDYPPFCFAVGERVVTEPGSLGIVIGGSGNGEQIAANKVPGVRAALIWNGSTAMLARQHNDANVAAVGNRQHSVEEATELVRLFLHEPFSGEARHVRRIGLLSDYERDRHRPAGGLPTQTP
ncbi:ribose-5-phosphate isomerase [Modestobacter muralis]|uniref:Ribose-5-phosphate isomerase B n=1 Tax=Modestobacter muralis TaxID=1608614 RepID=A0A6P0H7C2_9ACTN|nr:ribose-5-phosphate isomerase [Modestobacter muralis]NEN51089.1 ribose-5-phosphate isomerase [Modestobacter muralis]